MKVDLVEVSVLRLDEDHGSLALVEHRLAVGDEHSLLRALVDPDWDHALPVGLTSLLVDQGVLAGYENSTWTFVRLACRNCDESMCASVKLLDRLPHHVIQAQVNLVRDEALVWLACHHT